MPDNTIPSAEELFRVGRNAASLEQKAERLASIRQQSPELARQIDAGLVIPCHYEMFRFNTASPEAFVETCVRIEQPYRLLKCGERLSSDALLQS